MKIYSVILVGFMSILVSCSSSDPDKRTASPSGDEAKAPPTAPAKAAPEEMVFEGPGAVLSSELGAWKISSAPRYFGPDNLYELINGGAEIYVDYGLKKMVTAEYRPAPDASKAVTVEIYDMGTPLGAFGRTALFLEARLDPSDAGKGLPDALAPYSILGDGDLITWKGPNLVHLTLIDESATATPESIATEGQKVLPELVAGILAKIGAAAALPETLGRFPEEHRIPRSEGWHSKKLMGIDGLGAGYLARYKDGDKSWTVFATEDFPSKEAAEEAWKSVKAAEADGRQVALNLAGIKVVGVKQEGATPLEEELLKKLLEDLTNRFEVE